MNNKTPNTPLQDAKVKQVSTPKKIEKKVKKKMSKKTLFIILCAVAVVILILLAGLFVWGFKIRDIILDKGENEIEQNADEESPNPAELTQEELDEIEASYIVFEEKLSENISKIIEAEETMDMEKLDELGKTQLELTESYLDFVNDNQNALAQLGVDVTTLKEDLQAQLDEINSKMGGGDRRDGRPDDEVNFTTHMFDTKTVTHITPLGELNGGYHEAQAIESVMINLKENSNGSADRVNIYAPTDMSLMEYSYHDIEGEDDPNWMLTFEVGQRYVMTLWHIEMPSEKIVEATTDTPKSDSRAVRVDGELTVSEGELIAYTRGTKQGHNWNIILIDYGHVNEFVNEARYKNTDMGRRLVGGICPFSLYPEDMKSTYLSLMGYSEAGQSDDCGSVSSDVEGTLSGTWFLDEGNTFEAKRDGDYVSPLSIHMTSANSVVIDQFDGEQFEIASGSPTFKKPSEITDEHCYKLVDIEYGRAAGWAYFQLISSTEMRVKYSSSGSCPSSYPGGGMTYYR